jgi:transposase
MVNNRFHRWSRAGIWKRIFERFAARSKKHNQVIGKSRGGRTIKVHAARKAT